MCACINEKKRDCTSGTTMEFCKLVENVTTLGPSSLLYNCIRGHFLGDN
jgi:hypothetical protein